MKRLVSMAAVGLSMVLLMPLGVAAQAQVDQGLEVTDPVGDPLAIAGPVPNPGLTSNEPAPEYLDITRLGLMTEGSDLLVTLEVAGDIPEQDPTVTEAYYTLVMQPDPETGFSITARQSDRWTVRVGEAHPPAAGAGAGEDDERVWPGSSSTHGKAELSGNRLVMRVPLERLGPLDHVRFLAYSVAVRDCTPLDPCDLLTADGSPSDVPYVWWRDTVPGDEAMADDSQWLTWDLETPATPGASTEAASAPASPEPSEAAPTASSLPMRDLSGLFQVEDLPTQEFTDVQKDLKGVHREFRAYLDARPAAEIAIDGMAVDGRSAAEEGLPRLWDIAFGACEQETRDPRVSRVRRPVFMKDVSPEAAYRGSFCVRSFGHLWQAYAFTADDAVYELMRRFVLDTAPTFEPEARYRYLEALAAIPGLVGQEREETDG